MATYEVFGAEIKRTSELASITVYYRTSHLRTVYREALESLVTVRSQSHTIYLVVNGSTDDTYEFIRSYIQGIEEDLEDADKSVVLIRSRKNLGFSRANMLAYEFIKKMQRPKYIALINDDFVINSKGVEKLLFLLNTNPWISGISGIVKDFKGNIQSYQYVLCSEYPFSVTNKENAQRPAFPTWLTGSFSIYRFTSLEKCGGLFSNTPFMYGDDVELGIRLWRCGEKVVVVPVEVGNHYGGASTRKGSPRRLFYEIAMYDALGRVSVGKYPCLPSLRIPTLLTYFMRSILYAIYLRYEGFLKSVSMLRGAFSTIVHGYTTEDRETKEPRYCKFKCTLLRRM